MDLVLGIVLIVLAVFITVAVLFQSSKNHNLSGTITGGAETFFGKQKGKTIDGILSKLTAVAAIIFAVVAIVLYGRQDGAIPTPEVGIPDTSEQVQTSEGTESTVPSEEADTAETPDASEEAEVAESAEETTPEAAE